MNYYVYNRPAGTVSGENPARFTWMPKDGAGEYQIEVDDSRGAAAYRYEGIDINFYTPHHLMEPGCYTYRVLADGEVIVNGDSFEIPSNTVDTPLVSREQRYKQIDAHPRLWIGPEKIERLRTLVAESRENEDCRAAGSGKYTDAESSLLTAWTQFMEQGAGPWADRETVKEPARYPDDVRVIKLWRQLYIDCQEALYTVKHCAVAWRVTGEDRYLEAAKRQLLELAHWDPEGSTARSYNDEASFRVTTALAWGYDWLHDVLTPKERAEIKYALLLRGRELFDYVKNQIQIHIKLLDSHGVRSLSMTLVPAALALFGEEAEAREWLDYIIEYFFAIFTPWGGENGGWAEGPTYWQSGVSFFTEANCLIREAVGIDVFKRPFFCNTGDFILNTYCQDLRFMAFGDMSDLGDYPGMKAGFTMNILSAVTESKNRHLYAWYAKEAKRRGKGTEQLFYNYGWWNFAFDELFFQMLFGQTTPETPGDQLMITSFDDIGWACIHKDMADERKHLALMFKSSPYGSVSHSHGDQNAFVLHAFGEPLAIQSGYYIGFWSGMHMNWRRHTKSKNAVLIDGIGQFAELKKTAKAEEMNGSAKSQYDRLIAAKGQLEACEEREDCVYIRGEAAAAFQMTVPYLKRNKRHVLFVRETFFVMIDEIELEQEGTVQWLLHGLHKFTLGNNEFSSLHGGAGLRVVFAGGDMELEQCSEFEGVDPAETEGLAEQWHVTASTMTPKRSHRIVSVLYPYRSGEEQELCVTAADTVTVRLGAVAVEIKAEDGGYRAADCLCSC